MFYYFPDNYTWSSAVMLSIMAGAAAEQEEHAEEDLRQGFRRSASARYLRASTAYEIGAVVASPINQTRKQ